jgi:hypothetical protein
MPGYFKSFWQFNPAMMKNRMSCCRFFAFTARTTPGVSSFSFPVLCISAKMALKPGTPFHISQDFQATVLIVKSFPKLLRIKVFQELS